MKAYFKTDEGVIRQAIETSTKKSEPIHAHSRCWVIENRYDSVVVEGCPQQVMFLIGELASHGEDGLMWIDR